MVDNELITKAVVSLMSDLEMASFTSDKLLFLLTFKLYNEIQDIFSAILENNTPENKKAEFYRLVKAGDKNALIKFASSYISLDEVLKVTIKTEKESLNIILQSY
jgi:hypothetical protein